MFIGVTGAIIADAFVSWLAFVETRFTWGTMLYFAISYPSCSVERPDGRS